MNAWSYIHCRRDWGPRIFKNIFNDINDNKDLKIPPYSQVLNFDVSFQSILRCRCVVTLVTIVLDALVLGLYVRPNAAWKTSLEYERIIGRIYISDNL